MQKHILSINTQNGSEGTNIAQFIKDNNYIFVNDYFQNHNTRENVIKLGLDICISLAEYDRLGLMHGGVKPSNIFVSPEGEFVLGDINVAQLYEQSYPNTSGVYVYMAPETLKEGVKSSVSDIYSLGIIMYKLLNNNRAPFRKTDELEDAQRALDMRMSGKKFPAPANADALLSEIILKACEYEPDRRYPQTMAMYDRLNDLVHGRFVTESYDDNENCDSVVADECDEFTENPPEVKNKTKGKYVILAAIAVLVCVLAVFGGKAISLGSKYSKAYTYLKEQRFDKARQAFVEISEYKNSKEMIKKCDYEKAEALLKDGETDKALEIFEKLSTKGYTGAKEKVVACLISKVNKLTSDGKKEDTEKVLDRLKSEKSSKAKEFVQDYKYNMANGLFKEKKYKEALEIFEEIKDKEMAKECNYRLAIEYMRDSMYTYAMEIFSKLDDYNDSKEQFENAQRWLIGENKTEEFLLSAKMFAGTYSNKDGDFVKYICDEDDNISTEYNLPYKKGKYFKLENGVHYHGSESTGWVKQWIFEPIENGKINLYNYIDGKIYTLMRE